MVRLRTKSERPCFRQEIAVRFHVQLSDSDLYLYKQQSGLIRHNSIGQKTP